MSILHGKISLHKRIRRHPVWNREAFSYGQAFTDLLLLAVDANCAPQTITIHGESFKLELGQVGYSIQRLAEDWKRTREWVSQFLKWCQNEGMLTVDSNRRRTIITILNYAAYQPTEAASDLASDTPTEAASDLAHNGKRVRETVKGKAPPIEEKPAFAEIPSEAEVLAEAQGYPGDLVRGIPAGIPDEWTLGWFAFKSGSGFPKHWRAELKARFVSDWISGNRKARSTALQSSENKKNSGRSTAQARFEISRELEEIAARLDACHETSVQPDPADKAREKILRQELKALETSVQT